MAGFSVFKSMTQMKTKLQGLAVDYVVVLKQRILDNRIPVQNSRGNTSGVNVKFCSCVQKPSREPDFQGLGNSKILNLNHRSVKKELERWLSG